jgi:hypothetical protein
LTNASIAALSDEPSYKYFLLKIAGAENQKGWKHSGGKRQRERAFEISNWERETPFAPATLLTNLVCVTSLATSANSGALKRPAN